ncbi:MAG: molybdopterin-dependent oxidoreductase [Thermoanaerobaculia bacterium]
MKSDNSDDREVPHTTGSATRRELVKMLPIAFAAGLFVPSWRKKLFAVGLEWSDRVAQATFRPQQLAPVFADSELLPLDRFPYNYYLVADPEIDLEGWYLEVSGAVTRPGRYRVADFARLPKVVQNTRLVCVEGWEAIGNFGGAHLADFLDFVGADPEAGFVEVDCADDYYQSIDMASARHQQSLLCYEMYGRALDRGHGAPLRLALPTKLGYKQAKFLTRLKVSRVLGARRGLWEDQGYDWHGGL